MEWFFEIPEAVAYLRAMGVRHATLRSIQRLIRLGKIPHLKIQGKRYVTKDLLDKWIAKTQTPKKSRKKAVRR